MKSIFYCAPLMITLLAFSGCSKKSSNDQPILNKDVTVTATSLTYSGLGSAPTVIYLNFTDGGVAHVLSLTSANVSPTYDATISFADPVLTTASSTAVADPNSVSFFDVSNLKNPANVIVNFVNPKGGYKSITVTTLNLMILDGQSNTSNYIGVNMQNGLNQVKIQNNGAAGIHYQAVMN